MLKIGSFITDPLRTFNLLICIETLPWGTYSMQYFLNLFKYIILFSWTNVPLAVHPQHGKQHCKQ